MRNFVSGVSALVVAAIGFALTVGLVLVGRSVMGFDLFSLMLWGFIPVGAFLTGLFAASGYYVGAVKFNVKPTGGVAIGMLVVAGLVQMTLYYFQYASATTEDGQAIMALVSFPRYVGWMLTHAEYGLIVYGYRPDGGLEVGFFGYVIAVIQFVALVVGGFAIYAFLTEKTYCDECKKYAKKILDRAVPFSGDLETIETLRTKEPLSSAYFDEIEQMAAGKMGKLELQLSRCEKCGKEALTERPRRLKEDGTVAVTELMPHRTTWTEPGMSVADRLAELPSAS